MLFNGSLFATSLECRQLRLGLSYWVVFSEALLAVLIALKKAPQPADRPPVTLGVMGPVMDANGRAAQNE